MSATTTTEPGQTASELRAARERIGLTRAQVARLADCSLAQLGNLEAGAIPHRSAVLERVYAVLADRDERPAGRPGVVTTSAEAGGGHVDAP